MPLILPGNVGSATAATGYQVDNSCRFDDGSSAYMHRTPSAGNRRTMTLSVWIKGSSLADGSNNVLGQYNSSNENNAMLLVIEGAGKIMVWNYTTDAYTMDIRTNRLLRDNSSWYNIVVAVDTTQSTASNRVKVYVNGVQETSFSNETYPSQDLDLFLNQGVAQNIGTQRYGSTVGSPFDGYMAEFCFIDGTQNAVTDFGEFDEDSGIWKPINVSGLTFGTNGYYLDFEDSSALGNDVSGNDNDFTTVNLAAIDQSTDTCTNNFCTMNALDNFYAASTLSEGNLKVLTISGNAAYNPATFGLTKGKWYWEVKLVTCSAGDDSEATIFGISNQSPVNAGYDGSIQIGDGFGLRGNGNIWSSGGTEYGWNTVAVGNIVSVAVDFDNGKFYTATNGTYGNSSNPSTASNGYSFTVGTDAWFPGVNQRETSQTGTFELNFGSPSYAISSGNTDGDGYGNFEYAVPSGYYSLNTKNLAEYG